MPPWFGVLAYPFTMTHTPPRLLDYTERGSGPAVLLLHGFPLTRAMWDDQVEPLAERFRTIVPDLRGHGSSPASDGPFTMDDYVADLVALIDRLGVERAALVGLSMGGYVILNLIARHPERVWAIVLADTRAPADAEEVRQVRQEQAQLVLAGGTEQFVEMQVPRMVAPSTVVERSGVVERYRAMVRANRPTSIAAALAGLAARDDMTSTLESIGVPTLVVVGAEDVSTPPSESRLLAERVPGARLVTLEGVGHLSNMEAPDRFNAALIPFLTESARAQGLV